MNTKAIGEISEGIILGKLIQLGYAVAMPFGNNQRYDMIIDEGGELLRAQCKTGRLQRGAVVFKTCSTNGFTGANKSYFGEIDLFLVYCPETDSVYRVPVMDAGKRMCRLRVKAAGNGQKANIRAALDFVLARSSACRASVS